MLTPHQYRVTRALVAGETTRQIAAKLGIKLNAAHQVISKLLQKLGLRNRVQLVIWAYNRPEDPQLWPLKNPQ